MHDGIRCVDRTCSRFFRRLGSHPDRQLAIAAKIETAPAVRNLPEIIVRERGNSCSP
jgi:pyruvate kinase